MNFRPLQSFILQISRILKGDKIERSPVAPKMACITILGFHFDIGGSIISVPLLALECVHNGQ